MNRDDIDALYITEEEAIARGMETHAGPYNLAYQLDLDLLLRCLEDFRNHPERKFALVKKAYVCPSRRGGIIEITTVWADNYLHNPRSMSYVKVAIRRRSKDILW